MFIELRQIISGDLAKLLVGDAAFLTTFIASKNFIKQFLQATRKSRSILFIMYIVTVAENIEPLTINTVRILLILKS